MDQVFPESPGRIGFPGGASGKDSTFHEGDMRDTGSIPGSGRSPGVGNGNPFQYVSLENSMDREAWWATVHGAAESQTQLSTTVVPDISSSNHRSSRWVILSLSRKGHGKFMDPAITGRSRNHPTLGVSKI